jgi:uncharacterized protein YjbJ (UPF0337 family)
LNGFADLRVDGDLINKLLAPSLGLPNPRVRRAGSFIDISYQEQVMSMNKDQGRGRVKEARGKIKEVAGKLMGNKDLQAKGKAQRVLGKAQAKFGDVKQDVKDSKKTG